MKFEADLGAQEMQRRVGGKPTPGALGDSDMLFLRRDRAEPLVVVQWRVWARLLS
jgi:hypothetical protein